MSQAHVAIVGAGPAGLIAALSARALGLSAIVFEQAPRFEDVGAGLLLHSNGLRVLDALGLLEPFRSRLRPVRRLTIELPKGRLLARFDYGELMVPHDYASAVPRHELQSHLLDAVLRERIPVHVGHRLIAVSTARRLASLRFANGSEYPFDVVVACDGIGSRTRASLGLPARKRAIGEAYLRAVVHRPTEAPVCRELWGRDGRRFGICPLADERTYFFCSAPLGRWRDVLERGVGEWIESWRPYGAEVVALLGAVSDWRRVHHDELYEVRMRRWYRDPVFLIGDAAHAMTPNLGQGANSAMVDALVLMQLLAPALRERRALDEVGRQFERVRRAFVVRTQTLSRRLGRVAGVRSASARCARNALLPLARRLGGLNRRMLRVGAGYNPDEEGFFEAGARLRARLAASPAES